MLTIRKVLQKAQDRMRLDDETTVLKGLIEDLLPLAEAEEKKPAWMIERKRPIDFEALVIISQELANLHEDIKIEDSRSLQQFCMEAAELFTEYHYNTDPDYWSTKCYTDLIFRYCDELRKALKDNPAWINTEHNSMHGSGTADTLMEEYLKKKYPMRILDPIQDTLPDIMRVPIGENTFVRVNRKTGYFRKVKQGVEIDDGHCTWVHDDK